MRKQHTLLKILLAVVFIAIPTAAGVWAKALDRAINEQLTVGTIKRFYDAQATYARNHGNGAFGDVGQLWQVGLVDDLLVQGEKHGYLFTFSRTAATATLPSRFVISARPRVYRRTGIRSFYMTSTCLVIGADKGGGYAGPADPVIGECTPTLAYESDQKALIGAKVLAGAEYTFFSTAGGGFGAHDQLLQAGLLMNPYGPLGTPSLGYSWTVIPRNGKTPGFKIFATPSFYRETGMRSFFVDEMFVLRGLDRQGAAAHEDDPPIDPCPSCSPSMNESTAKFLARFLWGSEQMFAFGVGDGTGVGNGEYGTLRQLQTAGVFYLPTDSTVFEGYFHTLELTPSAPGTPPRFTFTITPQQYGVTGFRSFFIDETGVLRGADKGGAVADANDPPVLL